MIMPSRVTNEKTSQRVFNHLRSRRTMGRVNCLGRGIMTINIGDTPQQLEQGLLIDGEVWTSKRIYEMQEKIKKLKSEIIPENYIAAPADAWHNLAEAELERDKLKLQNEKLQSAYHQIKKAVSGIEICGVPLHHLSHDLSKHFYINTFDFSLDMKQKHLHELRQKLRASANKNDPIDVSDDMAIGWKSAMMEAFSVLDREISDCIIEGKFKGEEYKLWD